jgi:tRNA dimethylallyltransferase
MMIADKGIAMPENAKNKRYLLRALEQGGVKSQPKNIDHNALVIGLNPGMQELENRIRLRASAMQKNGALQEAQWLFEQFGYSAAAASAPFFKAYAPYFTGVSTLQECLARDCTLNRQLAKRQLTWFKRNEYIHWFASSELAQKFVLNTIT